MSDELHDAQIESRWESVGPFHEYRCLVNGWQVPLLNVRELDGGRVFIVINGWRGYECSVEEADGLIPFLADVIASAMGYRSHPRRDDDPEEIRPRLVAAVPHESLAPARVVEITAADTDQEEEVGS